MIFDVTKPLPQRIEFGGKKYALDLSYNRVLDVYALMREDMDIRSRKIPKRNKNNAEYIASLLELKQYYALEISQEERELNFKKGLAGLAETLKARAMNHD